MSEYRSVDDVLNKCCGVIGFSSYEQPPDINSQDIFGNTPLGVVVTWGDLEAAKLLVENGADLNIHMEDGNTPLHEAIEMGEFEIARYLLSKGADAEIRNNEGKLARDLCWEGEWAGIFGETET